MPACAEGVGVPVCACVCRVWVCLCVYAQCTGHMVCMSNISAHSFSSTVAMGTNDDLLKLADVHHNMTPLVASRWYNLGRGWSLKCCTRTTRICIVLLWHVYIIII